MKAGFYTLDDLQTEMGNLCRLLEVATDKMQNLDYGPAAKRPHDLDRVAALFDIATAEAQRIDGRIEQHFNEIRTAA